MGKLIIDLVGSQARAQPPAAEEAHSHAQAHELGLPALRGLVGAAIDSVQRTRKPCYADAANQPQRHPRAPSRPTNAPIETDATQKMVTEAHHG